MSLDDRSWQPGVGAERTDQEVQNHARERIEAPHTYSRTGGRKSRYIHEGVEASHFERMCLWSPVSGERVHIGSIRT